MKNKILFIIFAVLLCLPTFALAGEDWGIFDDYNAAVENYALYKAINNIPVRYSIKIFSHDKEMIKKMAKDPMQQLNAELSLKVKEEELSNIIQKAFYTWFNDTLAMIQNEGRSQEFADIKKILLNKIKLERVSEDEEKNISFFFAFPAGVKQFCGEEAGACIFTKWSSPAVILIDPLYYGGNNNLPLSTAIHEIGHYFALGDQYRDFGDISLVYSTFNRMNTNDAIMGASPNIHLSCDDVDGFINLIDLTLYLKNGVWSKRAQKGWASFCNGKLNGKNEYYEDEFYKEASLINKPDYIRDDITYHYDEDGNLIR